MSSNQALYAFFQTSWDAFSSQNGYPPHKLKSKDRQQIIKRLRAQPNYAAKISIYWPLIHEHCKGYNLWGDDLKYKDFMSASNLVFALNKAGLLP